MECSWKWAIDRASDTTAALSGRKTRDAQPRPRFFPTTACCSRRVRKLKSTRSARMFARRLSRKSTLVEHGFRAPKSALDNRPLRFDDWGKERWPAGLFSATALDYEVVCPAARCVEAGHPAHRADRSDRSRRARARAGPRRSWPAKKRPRRASAFDHDLTKRLAEDLTRLPQGERLRASASSELDAFERVTISGSFRVGRSITAGR